LPKLPLDKTQLSDIAKGGYVLDRADNPELQIIASGSEVGAALEAKAILKSEKINIVSMPCLDLFNEQDHAYRESVILPNVPKLFVEMSHPASWGPIASSMDKIMGIETFGESAPGNILIKEFGFDANNIASEAKKLLG
jgi:transketolase